MKARVHLPLSSAEKKMVDRVIEQTKAEIKENQNRSIVRAIKIACLILNEEFGFGIARLKRFLDEMSSRSNQSSEKPEAWFYVDEKLRSMGLDFQPEDISEREEHCREIYHEQHRKFRE